MSMDRHMRESLDRWLTTPPSDMGVNTAKEDDSMCICGHIDDDHPNGGPCMFVYDEDQEECSCVRFQPDIYDYEPPDDYDPGPECDDEGGMSEYRFTQTIDPGELL